jgi:Tfp pilus assembly protein PilP
MILAKRFFVRLVSLSVAAQVLFGFNYLPLPSQALAAEPGTEAEQPAFVYSPVGQRDPFVPLIQQINKAVKKPKKDMGPLEKYELSQFRLLAMLIIKGTPRAMVKAPDGKSYTVKPGDLIGPNGGVVKRIETKTVTVDKSTGQRLEKSPDRVVIEEPVVDNFTGKVSKKDSYIEM